MKRALYLIFMMERSRIFLEDPWFQFSLWNYYNDDYVIVPMLFLFTMDLLVEKKKLAQLIHLLLSVELQWIM